jgi:hypothetical protein
MAFLGTILRARRGEFNLFLIAALVALLVMPGASHAVLPPQGCEAVLFWLQNETATVAAAPISKASALLSISHQNAEKQYQSSVENQLSAATFHCGQFSTIPTSRLESQPQAPQTLTLERHAVAHLSGVRTNRRLI